MDIALVSHIEHQSVATGIKNTVDGNRQFYCTEIGC